MTVATEDLARLKDGNRRVIAHVTEGAPLELSSGGVELAQKQEPKAIIVGCSDARVPAEMVFDQRLGNLFVIRVAGNVVAPPQIGSIEFAAEQFGTRLVVVLGHSGCGAVAATVNELIQPSEGVSPNLAAIVDQIRPSVEALLESDLKEDRETLIRAAVTANVRHSVGHLRQKSSVLDRLVAEEGLEIVGAEYSLQSGEVTFLDDEAG